MESRSNDETKFRHIVVVKGASSTIKKARQEQAKAREESELEDAIGFSRQVFVCFLKSPFVIIELF